MLGREGILGWLELDRRNFHIFYFMFQTLETGGLDPSRLKYLALTTGQTIPSDPMHRDPSTNGS